MNVEQRRMQQRGRYAQKSSVNNTEGALDEDEYDDVWPTRISSSARRYQGLADVRTETGRAHADVQPFAAQRSYRLSNPGGRSTIPPRRSAVQADTPVVQGSRRRAIMTDEVPIRHSGKLSLAEGVGRPRFHWLVFMGMALFTMLVGWVILTMLSNWWQVTSDDWHYGRPRTYQVDAVVGHNDSALNPSHFIALNLRSHIEIIEFPGGDASKAKMYVGPTLIGPGQDLAAVTLTFKDVNGDGKVDMIVNVENSHFVFINDHGQFRPARSGENMQL